MEPGINPPGHSDLSDDKPLDNNDLSDMPEPGWGEREDEEEGQEQEEGNATNAAPPPQPTDPTLTPLEEKKKQCCEAFHSAFKAGNTCEKPNALLAVIVDWAMTRIRVVERVGS